MRIQFLFIILSGIILSACDSGLKGKSFLQKEKIKGNVKKFNELCYFITEDSREKLIYIDENYIDENGDRTMEEIFNADHTLSTRHEFEYDNRHNIIAVINYYKNEEKISKGKYKYDERNNLIEYINSNPDLNSTVTYKYDLRGNAVTEVLYDKYGNIDCKYENVFDEKNNLIKKMVYVKDTLDMTTHYKYDSLGNKVELKDIKSDKSISSHVVWKYDNKNNLMEEIKYDWQDLPYTKKQYKYESFDTYNNWLIRIRISDGIIEEKKIRSFEYY